MKRMILAASVMLVVFFAGAGLAQSKAPTKQEIRQYLKEYHQARHEFGANTVGCDLVQGPGECHVKATRARIEKSRGVIYRMLHPVIQAVPAGACWDVNTCAPHTQSTVASNYVSPTTSTNSTASYVGGGGLADVPGVPSSFASCVAFQESTNGELSSNIYGIQGPGGQGSISQQKQAFSQMYASRGTEPWHRYDGC